MTNNVVYLKDKRITKKKKKKQSITIPLDEVIGFVVDQTLLLQNEADSQNIKNAINIVFDKYKEDYENVIIKF